MKDIIKLISEELNQVQNKITPACLEQNAIYNELYQFINSPAKRIRSMLAILCIKASGRSVTNSITDILAAGELIHNASLLHDDVLDNAKFRRGHLTIAESFSPKVAILCGDFLLSIATRKLIELNNIEILQIFQNCTQKMSEAEIKQFSFRGIIPDEETYIEICAGKTASLFEAILTASFIICDKNNILEIKKLARNFGILFQLKNDMEKTSANADKQNQIYTLKDILGIEKTNCLTDNYSKRVKNSINMFPKNIYAQALEELLQKI